MLLKLFVQNYALIKNLDVKFEEGLTIITGETGAGKSILLGALSLILGNRADTSVLLEKNEKCLVEGTFRIEDYDLTDFYLLNDIDYEPVTVLRREINPAGKSRAFINDTPVTVNVLKELGDKLIDIHSQHQTLMLNDNSFQLNVIDSFAGTINLKKEYKKSLNIYNSLHKEFKETKEIADKNRADYDYYLFQLKQLDDAKLKVGETEELEKEQELLSHAEEIKLILSSATGLFSAEGNSILPMLREAKMNILKIKDFIPGGDELLARSESAYIDLNDLSTELEKFSESISVDPQKLKEINDKLDVIYSLLKKHRAENETELIGKREEIRKLVDSISTSDERLEELNKKIQEASSALSKIAGEISSLRSSVVKDIELKITELLKQLGMPNAKFKISLIKLKEFTSSGTDKADFLFSANKQIEPEDLAKTASGGELSRVMLSLKSLLTKNNNLPTIIFDEIDSGVSGEVADKVGQILSSMGRYMQVINITHLPQVAARGTMHYHVFKDETSDSTITRIRLLTMDERIKEVARLLSGSVVTDIAVKNARELLKSAQN